MPSRTAASSAGTRVVSIASWTPPRNGSSFVIINLKASVIVMLWDDIEVVEQNIGCNGGSGLAANPGGCSLQRHAPRCAPHRQVAEPSGSGRRSRRRRRSKRYAAESKRISGLVGRAVKTRPANGPP